MTRKIQIFLVMMVSTVLFMEFLDLSIINTAVPTIAKNFAVSPILLKFAVASYYLSLAVFIPISGWCADRFGTKTIFIIAVLIFTIASIICGVSNNSVELTIFRFLQGLGGAFMNPVSRIIVLRAFPPKDLVRVQGIMFTPALIGMILGPFLGGIITQYLSWHWIFFINIPIGVMAIIIGYKIIVQYKSNEIKKFDWGGFALVGCALVCITFFVEMLDHDDILSKNMVMTLGGVGFTLFMVAIFYCIKKQNSIFELKIFKINAFNVSFVTNAVTYATNASIMFMLPLLFQECFGYTPSQSGYLVLPIAVSMVIMRSQVKNFIERFGFHSALKISSLLFIFCLFNMIFFTADSLILYIIFIEVLYGCSIVLSGSSTGALCYVNTSKNMVSNATALDLTFRQFFASLGVGITSFCLTNFAYLFDIKIFTPEGVKVFHATFIFFMVLGFIPLFNSFRLKKVVIS